MTRPALFVRLLRQCLVATALVFTSTACGSSEAREAADSEAVPDQSVVASAPEQVVETPAEAENPQPTPPAPAPREPVRPAPPAPPPPAPKRVIPAETSLVFQTNSTLSTKSNVVGELFDITLVEDVYGDDGKVVLVAGSMARGRVTASEKSASSDEPAVLRFALDHLLVDGIEIHVSAEIVETGIEGDTKDSRTETAAKIAGGAAVGALVGRLLGSDRGDAVKGAVVGSAAGTVLALTTRDGHAELPAGAGLTFRVDEEVVIR